MLSVGWTWALSSIIHISPVCEHWNSRSPDLSKVLSAKSASVSKTSHWGLALSLFFSYFITSVLMHLKHISIHQFYVLLIHKIAKGIWFAQVFHTSLPHFRYDLSFSFPISVSPPKAQFQISFLWPPSHVFECLMFFTPTFTILQSYKVSKPSHPQMCTVYFLRFILIQIRVYAVSCLTKYTMKSAFHCEMLWYWYCVMFHHHNHSLIHFLSLFLSPFNIWLELATVID